MIPHLIAAAAAAVRKHGARPVGLWFIAVIEARVLPMSYGRGVIEKLSTQGLE